MQKLVLLVSRGVPELPEEAHRDANLTVRRIDALPPGPSAADLRAFLLDTRFLRRHEAALSARGFPKGSVVVWNPNGEPAAGGLPEGVVYQEIGSLSDGAGLLCCLRNLYRTLFLEQELARKEELLRAKRRENQDLLEVGIALSAERDNDKLLDLILRRIREFTGADAGSLYLVTADEKSGARSLLFKIAQNDSNPTDFTEFSMPLDKRSIGGYVASTGKTLNIRDAYKIPPEVEYSFNKSYDEKTGYRTKSILTVPMKDHKDQIIGAVQLINRKKDGSCRLCTAQEVGRMVLPFSKEHESLATALASQAAVSLENNQLYEEIERLFEGFVRASVKAIESRDPTTSGHSNRVAVYTVGLAEALNRVRSGTYGRLTLSPDQLKEIRYASLLHDFGKVGVREHVLVKAKKLHPHQMELLEMRFAYIQKTLELSLAQQRFAILKTEGQRGYEERREKLELEYQGKLEELRRYLETLVRINEPAVLEEEPGRILEEIARRTYIDLLGQERPVLTPEEHVKLKVVRGSLDEAERHEIESHVTHTYHFLKTIPWTRAMQRIPLIAYGHHEKLDGGGYPRGLVAEEIPLQTRMMTISDIFDALTAMDRPYKPAVSDSKALDILGSEVEGHHVDEELLRIFIEARIWKKREELLNGASPNRPA